MPTALGRAALEDAPGKRGVAVQGRYGHVSFIVDPVPLRLTVREVPPYPPKLYDQTRRLLEVAEHLPPIDVVPEVDLTDLARSRPSNAYLLALPWRWRHRRGRPHLLSRRATRAPCRPHRLRALAADPPVVLRRAGGPGGHLPTQAGPAAGAVLTKCCLFEGEIVTEPDQVVVPWGASLAQISEALTVIANAWEPSLARLTDSRQYAHLWGTAELAQVFEERGSRAGWTSSRLSQPRRPASGSSRAQAAAAITGHARAEALDLDYVAEQTRRTAHSMLGLIRGLQQVLPESAREHVYVGATVQDVTDTWFALVMRDVVALVWRDLRAIEGVPVEIAVAHRDTVMVGRTHGQPGAPITFGFKVASWADEVRRHVDRLREGRPRWLVGQLAGCGRRARFFEPAGPACGPSSVPSWGWAIQGSRG